jgi:2-desacetyl-2-hydroxyethyl bacteriochlorophyllide A dehydrogenase
LKTVICEDIGRLKQIEDERPTISPGNAIIRIKRIGICGTDLHAYRGNQPFFTYPRVLGHELAGIIEEIGPNDRDMHIGDQVTVIPYLHCGSCVACRRGKTNCCTSLKVLGVHTDGGMREYISVPITHVVKTDGLTLDQTAVIEPLSIGAHAVRRSGLHSGETALVIGSGPIGLGVMASAKQLGAKVIAMDLNEERLRFARRWAGIDETVLAGNNAVDSIAERTGGDLPTVVFDATGSVRSMEGSFQFAANGGTLVFVGLVKSDIAFHDPEFHRREMTLMSSRNATVEDFLYVIEGLRMNRIDVNEFITHRATLEDVVQQFDEWLLPESRVVKAVLEV